MNLQQIKKIERLAYPESMQEMQDITELQEYLDSGVIHIVNGPQWYCLITIRGNTAEVADLAKVPGSPPVDWWKIVRFLEQKKIKKVVLDAREDTSYPKILKLIYAIKAKIVKDKKWKWDGHAMHAMTIKLPGGKENDNSR